MRPLMLTIIFFTFLVGCSAHDRVVMTEFEPLGLTSFRYKAIADAAYPEDSTDAEKTRLGWLEQYLRDNNLCPKGYTVSERKAVLVRAGLVGDIHNLFYYGKCK